MANRQEARPLKFRELTDSQKEAAESVAQSLLSALEDLEANQTPGGDPASEIDNYRPNQIFFVSGEPGSGKTALYLTIRKLLADGRVEIEEGFQGLKSLREKSAQLRWLEPLDLEPAADSANFLAAMLVRIEAEVEEKALGRSLEQNRRPGLLEDRDVLQELLRLQSDIVLAWDGTVSQRAERIEPDIFAQEVLRAEKARLRVNRRLRDVLARLSGARKDKKEERVLYVLPVDDFYLKPASSLEFLRLLRMISVPQLFILVLGDLDVVSELFNQDMLGQLVRLAGEGSLRAIPTQESALTARAGALTSHAMRKLIPLSQRSVLQAMHKLQALDFSPPGLGGKGEQEKLEALLKAVSLSFNTLIVPEPQAPRIRPRNFLDFLLLQDRGTEAKADFYTYSGLAILDLPPREVVDLWHGLAKLKDHKAVEEKAWKKILGLVVEQTLEALDHQTYLDLKAKERCREAIQGTAYDQRTFQRDALQVEPRSGRDRRLALGEGKILVLSPHDAWVMRPRWDESEGQPQQGKNNGSRKNGEGKIDYLAPRPTAWFTVLHDLMAMSSADCMEGKAFLPQPFQIGWAVVTEKNSERKLSWPTPAWPSFRHFDLLAFRWRKVLEALDKKAGASSEELRSWLVYNWLDSITEILKAESWETKKSVPDLEIGEDKWKALQRDTLSLLDKIKKPGMAGGHYDVIRGWLLRLSIFLDPLFGIPSPVSKALKNLRLQQFWKKEKEEIEAIWWDEIQKPQEKGEPSIAPGNSSPGPGQQA